MFPREVTRPTGLNIQEIVHDYLYPYDNAMREMWFIVTLFWLMILVPVWRFVLKDTRIIVLVGLVLLVLHFWHPSVEFLCLGRVMSMAIWFSLGLVMCKMEVVEKYLEPQPWLTVMCGVAVYATSMLAEWSFLMTIGGILLSFGLSLLTDRHIPKLFCGFRNYSYQIFLMGIFAQIAVKILYRHLEIPYLVAFVLCLMFGLYVPVVVSKLLEWFNWKPLLMCVGLKMK